MPRFFERDLHGTFSNLHGSILGFFGVEGCAELKCYPSAFTTVHARVLSRLCAWGVRSVKGGERVGGWKGGVGLV